MKGENAEMTAAGVLPGGKGTDTGRICPAVPNGGATDALNATECGFCCGG